MADRPSTSKSASKDEGGPEKVTQLKKGTVGKRINIETNYLRLTITPPLVPNSSVSKIYMYDVYIYPPTSANRNELRLRPQRRTAFWTAVRNHYQVFGDESYLVYDDGRRLYSRSKLYPLLVDEDNPKPIENELEWDFEYTYKERPFKAFIKIIPTGSFRLTATETRHNQEQPRFLNCLLTQCLRLTEQPNLPNSQFSLNDLWFCVKRCVYRVPFDAFYEPVELGNCAVLLHGLRCDVKYDSNGRPLFNVKLASAVFAKVNLDLIDFYATVVNQAHLSEADLIRLHEYGMNDAQAQRMTDALRGLSLKTKHSNLHKKCIGLVKEHSRNYRFEHPQFGPMTVEEYFLHVYRRRLQYPYMPLVQVHPPSPLILFPMELLTISDEVQMINKRLPLNIRAKIAEQTSFLPPQYFDRIAHLLLNSTMLDNKVSSSFGLQFQQKFLQLEGRVLAKPKLYYQYAAEGLCEPANERFYFVLICLNDAYFDAIGRTVWELVKICRDKRMNIKDLSPVHHIEFGLNGNIRQLKSELQSTLKLVKEGCKPLFIVIKEDEDTNGYEAVKTTLDQQGHISQFIKKSNAIQMAGRNQSIMKSLVLKLNSKLGGLNNKVIDCHDWQKFTTTPTLIVGVDTIRAARNDDMPSVVGVTGSIDDTFARYSSGFCIFDPDEEYVPELDTLILNAIDAFAQHIKKAPKHIILLRGGLSDSQYDNVAKVEFGALGDACRRFEERYPTEFSRSNPFNPTVTYLIVSRKHSTRFKMETIPRGDRYNGNVPSGTVVDSVIAGKKDYYLCSHNGLLGTSRPAYYEMMYDTWRLTGDNLQSFMYSLCHLVGRSRLPVSIPAPLYYADLLCRRVCTYIHTEKRQNSGSLDYDSIRVEDSLKKLLYFA
ncbi:piwi domain-containing protein [Ditylenchus destructor]|uniref:Piwi domain-containing protein n=1 Tax=Ditylenchus destructor TaxID=166010 RepID=A0AAD4MSI6_9BILA|nr:piwi domain-containing protein [Ditylenchus destructor]